MLTYELCIEFYHYDEESGKLFNKERAPHHFLNQLDCERWNSRLAYKEVGTLNGDGYRIASYKTKRYGVHRIIWLLKTGSWPDKEIDHENGIRDDNKWSNLRPATSAQNGINKPRFKNNSSGYRGVSWQKLMNKWEARIMFQKKTMVLGYYETKEDAYYAYCSKCVELYGEFAHNDVKQFLKEYKKD